MEGRLSGWQNAPGGSTTDSFLYDATGARVEQQAVTSGTVTASVYVGALAEYDTTGGTTTITDYLSFAGKLVATHDSAWHYLLSDQVGTPQVQVGASGTPESLQLTTPYGSTRYAAVGLAHLGFTGQRQDSVPNLTYFNARYYDQQVGAFLSADTVAAGGLNRYAYVHGNPETFNDPSGHMIYVPKGEFDDGRYPGKRPNPRNLGRAQFDWRLDDSYPNGSYTGLLPWQHPKRKDLQANFDTETADGKWLAWYLGLHVDQQQTTDKHSADYDVYGSFTYAMPFVGAHGETDHFPVELVTINSSTPWDGDKNWVVPGGVVKSIFDKGQQASIVVVDLSQTDTSGVDLSDIAYRAVFAAYAGLKQPSKVARVIFISCGQLLLDYNPLDYGPPPADHSGTTSILKA